MDAEPDPHFSLGALMDGDKVVLGSGDWICYQCKRPLMGTYMRPVVPWRHRPDRPQATDRTEVAGLETTE